MTAFFAPTRAVTSRRQKGAATLMVALVILVILTVIVLASTNVALPRANWTTLGAPVEIQPGRYQFTQPPAPQIPHRFYLLRSE